MSRMSFRSLSMQWAGWRTMEHDGVGKASLEPDPRGAAQYPLLFLVAEHGQAFRSDEDVARAVLARPGEPPRPVEEPAR